MIGERRALAEHFQRLLRVHEAEQPCLGQRIDGDDLRAGALGELRASVSMRGWLVPGFWPRMKMGSALAKSSSLTVPLPMPMHARVSAVPLDSWHMFEQSGRLLVPNWRTKSW